MPVNFTRRALRDLANIRVHIANDNPRAASRVAVEIVAACDRLEYFPERGRPGLRRGTRELTTVWPYVIVYRVTGTNIDILAVWHGAQDRHRP
ncbi:MAG: type II toxin-antitoxin system RelE/ParE family toxin [Alphaproteobacteria bacterium]|nr:type II toxin-antitoxin system RelE/ParE family toxin [Alphaproteobacteria bacterium]